MINMVNGACLGHITDISIDTMSGCICGMYLAQAKSGLGKVFGSSKQYFIPATAICRIGQDVILVNYTPNANDGGKCLDNKR